MGTTQGDTSGRGLTDFGRDLIRELNRLGIIIDVSHLSYQSIYDALAVSTQPLLNSHSGALALNPEQAQLLPDDLLRAMADRGGVIGIHFISQVVKPGRDKATFEQLMRQFEYLANLIGTDRIACGPDYFYPDKRTWENQGFSRPFEFTEGVEDISKMANVTRGLVALGFSDEDIRKIMGGNLFNLFQSVRRSAERGAWEYKRYAEGIGAITGGSTPL